MPLYSDAPQLTALGRRAFDGFDNPILVTGHDMHRFAGSVDDLPVQAAHTSQPCRIKNLVQPAVLFDRHGMFVASSKVTVAAQR